MLTSPGSPPWRVAHAELEPLGIDLLLNVHSLYIVPEAVLRIPRYGAHNLHPGPLPQYAGLSTPSWAIYYGEAFHGVTLLAWSAASTPGRSRFRTTIPLLPDDTFELARTEPAQATRTSMRFGFACSAF